MECVVNMCDEHALCAECVGSVCIVWSVYVVSVW